MDKSKISIIVDNYYERTKTCIQHAKNINISLKDFSYLKMENFRNTLIETFIEDAIILKNLDLNEEVYCPRIKLSIPLQYSTLSKNQLIAYLGFRSKVRLNIAPSINNYNEFISLYLLEILNGIYGFSFEVKLNIIINFRKLFSYTTKFNNEFTEAFEILFIQHKSEIKRSDYEDIIPIEVFKNTSISKKNITEKTRFKQILSIYNIDKTYNLSTNMLFIINNFFREILLIMNKNNISFYCRNRNLNLNTVLSFKKTPNTIFQSIGSFVLFPLNSRIEYFDFGNNFYHEVIGGKKRIFDISFHELYLPLIDDIFKFIIDSLENNCGGSALPELVFKPKSFYFQEIENNDFLRRKKLQSDIENFVKLTISNHQYLKNALNISLTELINLNENSKNNKRQII